MATLASARTLRRDAQRNRERIVASARLLFARDGLDASVEDITRDAGVGMGTLYRHFATKGELVDAVLEESFEDLVELAEAAAAEPDAWAGFTGFLEAALQRYAANRGLKDVLAGSEQGRRRARAMRRRLAPLLQQLIARAQAQGALRADFTPEDMPLLFWTSGSVIDATAGVAPDCWRRHLGLALDGLRAGAATPLPVPALTPAQLERSRTRRGA
ncbi:MAG TPA: helix-turn-helix domain-containing protein [Gaiellales bacterium]|jgi:AcrR family transcriptional regulator|nr:helix-turn-helix domain-containing protein [Gaiellales bacterium]